MNRQIIKLLFLSLLLFACQRHIVKARNYPDKSHEIIPIGGSAESTIIDKQDNSITVFKNNIKVKVIFADFELLYNNFSYTGENKDFGYTLIYRLAPFYTAKKAKMGKERLPEIDNYFSELTVFYVNIENNSDLPIFFEPKKCVMVDGVGKQYSVLDEIFLRNNRLLYGYMEDAPFSGIKKAISPLAKILGEVGDIANAAASITPYNLKMKTSKDYYDETKRYNYQFSVDESLFLNGGEIFPTVNYSGFLVFRNLFERAFTFKLILPHIAYGYTSCEKALGYSDFEFNFSKIMTPKKAYFDSTTEKIYYK